MQLQDEHASLKQNTCNMRSAGHERCCIPPQVLCPGASNDACLQLQDTDSQNCSSPDGLRQPGVGCAYEPTAAQPHHQAHEHHARHACMCTRQHHAC